MSAYSPAEIIAELLIGQSLGGDPEAVSLSWPVYTNFLPDDAAVPDNAIGVFDEAGQRDGRNMEDGTYYWHYGVQVVVRGKSSTVAYERAKLIEDGLDSLADVSVTPVSGTSFTVGYLSQQSPILRLGHDPDDAKRRALFSLNFLTTITEA